MPYVTNHINIVRLMRMVGSIEELETLFDRYSPSVGNESIRENRLERMRLLLDLLGNPEKSFRCYHLAGSKGKGTTAAYLAALLTGSGRRTGLYLSPHMYTVRERFTLSASFFSDDLYIDTANELIGKSASLSLPESLGAPIPTTFEMYTAYGYLLFRNAGCTDAVIETGLGGRFDATNTIDPEAVILTPIELEHTAILGDTIRKIATEKSKIMRPGVPTFASRESDEARQVFEAEAENIGAPICFLEDLVGDIDSVTTMDGEKARFSIGGRHFSLDLSMTTKAMADNAALAVLAADSLGFLTERGLELLEKTVLPGRFEKMEIDGRTVVVDSAHTVNSARATADAFRTIASGRKALVYSSVEGKDIEHIISVLFPLFDKIVISTTGDYRKSDPDMIASISARLFPSLDITIERDRDKALEKALGSADSILVTGSFYLASGMARIREKEGL